MASVKLMCVCLCVWNFHIDETLTSCFAFYFLDFVDVAGTKRLILMPADQVHNTHCDDHKVHGTSPVEVRKVDLVWHIYITGCE